MFNDAQLELRNPSFKCSKTSTSSLICWHKPAWSHVFLFNVVAQIETRQTHIFYCPVLASLCDSGLSFFSWHSVWFSAAVAHVQLKFRYVVFRDFFCILCVIEWFFECYLPISLKHSCLFPLTSYFHPENCHSLNIFSFMAILCKLQRWLCGRIPVDR